MLNRLVRSAMRRGANAVGYQTRDTLPHEPSMDVVRDVRILLAGKQQPIMFDVGANIGQTIDLWLQSFPDAQIHAFEPGQAAFLELSKNISNRAKLNNIALGAEVAELPFNENCRNLMSSFLKLGPDGWGETKKIIVKTETLDHYCISNNIKAIDLLKIDTQGYEIPILAGATHALEITNLVLLEVTLHKLYEGLPSIGEITGLMIEGGFELVNFYNFEYKRFRLGWMDALFAKL